MKRVQKLLMSHFGTQAALAEAVGVSRQAVSKWFGREFLNGRLPPERCIQIESVTLGAIKREQLRPDHFGRPQR